MREQFDINRLLGLLRYDLLNRYRAVVTVSAAIVGLMLLQSVFNWPRVYDMKAGVEIAILGVLLFVWGPIAASRSFLEIHSKSRNEAYLLLPASALEKVLARALLITLIFGTYAIVFVALVAWLSAGVRMLIHGESTVLFFPSMFTNSKTLAFFFLTQSLFFLGGSWFRKQQFFKTILSLIAFWIGFVCVVFVVVRLFFPGFEDMGSLELDVNPGELFSRYGAVLLWLCYLGVPIFCGLVAWFRIREVQVNHGI